MQLDRTTTGQNKYALIRNRKLAELRPSQLEAAKKAIALLDAFGLLDLGNTEQSEFFVIKLQDSFAAPALAAYGRAAMETDREYGTAVLALAEKTNRIKSKLPD